MTKDLTEGKPLSLMLRFCIPLLLGNLLQQLYNLVDTIIVGRYLGITALSSIGVTGSVFYLIMGFCTGICAGCSIPVAQKFGAKNYGRMRMLVMNGWYLIFALGGVMTVLTVIFCREILIRMGTPQLLLEESCGYLTVIFAGIPITLLYNMTAGILRAMGDSKTPFYFLIVSTVLNILLDLLFVIRLEEGVAGAAWATVIAQAFSGILCFFSMKKRYRILDTETGERALNGECLKELVFMGIPLGLESSITAIGSVMLQSSVNGLGLVYVSAYTAVVKLKQFTINPYSAFDTAVATYISQNYGAGRMDRVREGVKAGLLIYGVYSAVIAVLLFFEGDKIALIFVDRSETEILGYVKMFFRYCSGFYFVVIFLNCYRSVIQGLGYGGASMLSGLCELGARAVMALVVIPAFGYLAVCFTDGAAWLAAGTCVVLMYYILIRKIRKSMETDQSPSIRR